MLLLATHTQVAQRRQLTHEMTLVCACITLFKKGRGQAAYLYADTRRTAIIHGWSDTQEAKRVRQAAHHGITVG